MGTLRNLRAEGKYGNVPRLSFLLTIAPLLFYGCGGGSGSSGSAAPTAPIVKELVPAAEVQGATIRVQGTFLSNPVKIRFNGADASDFAAESDSRIRVVVPLGAATGRISVVTSSGTATSAEDFTVTPSPLPSLSGFSPGTGSVGTTVLLNGGDLLGAASVEFNGIGAAFSVVGATQIKAVVPDGAATGFVSVTTPGGKATSGNVFAVTEGKAMDVSIEGLYVTQSSQSYPNPGVPLVKDRSAWVRVFVKADAANEVRPRVRVLFVGGETTQSLVIEAPGPGVPTTVNEGDAGSSWNAPVPADWIREGVRVIADVDPEWSLPESDRNNNVFPPDGNPLPLDVRTVDPLRITLIPVTTGDGQTGDVGASNLTAYTDFAARLFPVPDATDAAIDAGMASSAATLASDGTGWSRVLSEVSAKRLADGAEDRNYYGVVKVNYGSGVAGLGCVGCPVAVGWDGSSAGRVLAHELGHNFGRSHSPGCGAGNPDPGYPSTGSYSGGRIGVTGWDPIARSFNLKPASEYSDIMNYCGFQWISDYVYKNILEFRASAPFDLQSAAPGTAAPEGLLIWGRIENGRLILEPALPVRASGALPVPGAYTLEVGDARGRVTSSVPFEADLVEDLPGPEVRLFSFVLPYRAPEQSAIHSLRVTREGRELARSLRRYPVDTQGIGPSAPPVSVKKGSDAEEDFSLSWDAVRYPLVVVRDAGTGRLLAFQRGGKGRAKIRKERDVEIVACDGIGARVQRHSGSSR
jgi:hypothetical protein